MIMKYSIAIVAIIFTQVCFGQNSYSDLVRKGDSLYRVKDYRNSALAYSKAFEVNGWKGFANDRYNAACSWALSGNADSAFFQLERIATRSNYKNYAHITADSDLNSLHHDKRWQPLLDLIRQNKEKAEANLNRPLAAQLDSIYMEDQKYRQQMRVIEQKHGWESSEMKALVKLMHDADSVNLIKVSKILDTHGWLGADVVGDQGNSTLFLVIQHSDQKTQEKYLPMMREAVKNGKAQGSSLALLEDRVALAQGKKQIYGSQIHRDMQTGKYFVAPIEDEPNVNKRRAAVGLEPLEEYVKHWNITYTLPKQ
jgi:hypothetical protein